MPTTVQPDQPIHSLVDEMVARWPDLRAEMLDADGNLQRRIQIMVNGRSIAYLDGMNTVIGRDDGIAIFPPWGQLNQQRMRHDRWPQQHVVRST